MCRLTVVGSKEELRKLGGSEVDQLPELHRPWIDGIKVTCPVCGERVERVPEVGDVRDVIANALRLRNDNQLKVRQPLSTLYVDESCESVVNMFANVVKDELQCEIKKEIYINQKVVIVKIEK